MDVEKLNDERKKRKLSVAQLAEKANLPKGTVEKVLFGVVKNPRIDTMNAIEKALELSEWNEEDYKNGVINEKTVSITADDEEILDKFHEVKKAIGEQGKVLIIEFCNAILSKFKM